MALKFGEFVQFLVLAILILGDRYSAHTHTHTRSTDRLGTVKYLVKIKFGGLAVDRIIGGLNFKQIFTV